MIVLLHDRRSVKGAQCLDFVACGRGDDMRAHRGPVGFRLVPLLFNGEQ
eukprot:CAMPEP_0113586614 /NCGR_PEP_ID=MMETSP0015_2-20120614/34397_1 /TAXON_ID=2838 /ORGANISM="Odontella" /LENGTH=48 /DNA_ID=CAMNT_0000492075 /DNA_START=455 /DNA_END=601 /DNA_ORIENTATION=+ /assembly_acc=CAM_ASM_000160